MALAGEQFYNMDFSMFAQMVYPDSSPEDWL
jgi:hypothetical protein